MTTVDSSAHFREHDIEVLQDRTKCWLEAILGEKYGDRSLAELIADGNLLYRVSKHITREMTGKSPGPLEISPKTFSEVSAFGKQSGKYLPYANVDTFLKTCRKIGLTDVELFTPPDAVEGKDVRSVCTSIRSLARKARAQRIRVPDFEDVTRPMPKERVGEIKENLEHHTSLITPTVPDPEVDIEKSERVQIITKFLSATKAADASTEDVADSVSSGASTPVTPQKTTFSLNLRPRNSPSTPTATIEGIGSPTLTKSFSVMEHTQTQASTSPTLKSSASDVRVLDSTKKSVRSPLPSTGFGFRHANPHFIKNSPETSSIISEGKTSDQAVDLEAKLEQTTATVPSSSDSPETSPFSQFGLGTYRHAHPHFSFRKTSQADSTDFSSTQDLESKLKERQPELEAPRTPSLKVKAPSSNKVVEKDPKKSSRNSSIPGRSQHRAVARVSQPPPPQVSHPPPTRVGHPPPTRPKERIRDREAKVPSSTQRNSRLWMPLVAGALAFLGTLLLVRTRDRSVYEVKKRDRLSEISKQVGKNWDEIIKLNPSISNPHLIYPSDRLKLPV